MTTVTARLPLHDEHIPKDGKLPDLAGLPVRVNYEGAPIGKVIACKEQGDGTVIATLELDLPERYLGDVNYGLDARAKIKHRKFRRDLVETITRVDGVGVWAEGERPTTRFPHTPENVGRW